MTATGARRSTSSGVSNLSASATVVNSNSTQTTPRIPGCAIASNEDDSSDDSSSSDEFDEHATRFRFPPGELPDDPIQGWPQLALLMAKTPDFAAFSRFRDLNTKSLLYYQAELRGYRKKLHNLEYEDAGKGNWWDQRADLLVESKSVQFETVVEMRKVLKEYNKALKLYTEICALPGPEPDNMRALRKWLGDKRCGDNTIRGRDGLNNTWGDMRKDPDAELGSLWRQFGRVVLGLVWARPPPTDDLDLVATEPQGKIDGLTRWVVCDLVRFYKNFCEYRKEQREKKMQQRLDIENTAEATPGCFGRWREKKKRKKERRDTGNMQPTIDLGVDKVKKEDTLESWGDKTALRVTSTISTVIACLLPVIAISILSQLHGLRNLLICLAGFAIFFALALIFLTQGTSSRTEIFAATAAFSAVMVVFISVPPAPIINMPPGSPMPSVTPRPTYAL